MRVLLLVLVTTLALTACAVDVPEPVVSSSGNICCGENCCLIELVDNPCGQECWANGQRNCVNPCQECNTTVSDVAWTDIPGCTFDAGMPDAGPVDAGVDAGADEDAGPPPVDLGPGDEDAGVVAEDQGVPSGVDAGPSGGGMGCTVEPGRRSPLSLAVLLLGLGLLLRRRRR